MNHVIKLALVGGGQMGRALIGGMSEAKIVNPNSLRLVEPNAACRDWWSEKYPDVSVVDLHAAVSASEIVLLAVKPNMMAEVAKQKARFWSRKLVVSIAAGVNLDSLCGWIGHGRVVRVMPNTPCLVGAGASGYCCGSDVSEDDRAIIQSMLGSVGFVTEVSESQMDAVTGLSGSGPAYVCLMIEALADGGVLAGLPRPLSLRLATQTVLGTAKMIIETGRHPAELKDSVASPGGTTIAALASLEHNGFRGALIQAVAAAADRSRELGK